LKIVSEAVEAPAAQSDRPAALWPIDDQSTRSTLQRGCARTKTSDIFDLVSVEIENALVASPDPIGH